MLAGKTQKSPISSWSTMKRKNRKKKEEQFYEKIASTGRSSLEKKAIFCEEAVN